MFHSLENTPDRPTKALQYKSAAQISNQATPIQQRRNQPLQPIRPHQQQPGDSDLPRPDGRVATISWPPSQPSSSPSATPPAPKWSPSALATMPSADVRSTAAHTNHAIKRSSEAANVLEEAASKKFKPSITPVVSKPTSAHPPTATQGPPSASAALPTCFFCFANTLGSFTPWHGVRYCDECRKKHARSKYIGPYRNLAMKFLLTKGQVSRVPFVEQPTEKAFYYISKREDLATKAEQVHGSLRACLEKKLRKAEQQAIKNDAADAGASGENEDDGENAGYRNKSNGTAPAAASTNQVHPVPVPRPSVPFKPWNAPMMSERFFCLKVPLAQQFSTWRGVRYCAACRGSHARSKHDGTNRKQGCTEFHLKRKCSEQIPFVKVEGPQAFQYISKRVDFAKKAEEIYRSLNACLEAKLKGQPPRDV